jgi:hypothetical protein
VQHLGKLIIVWRPQPEPVVEKRVPAGRRNDATALAASQEDRSRTAARKSRSAATTARQHGSAPGARRRRTPR